MARDDNRNWVAIVRHPYRAEATGPADRACNIAVSAGLAIRNRQQRSPARLLHAAASAPALQRAAALRAARGEEGQHDRAATGGHQRDLGQLKDPNGNTIVVPGLWSLEFGSSGGASGNANELYFTAGPNGYADGLFGNPASAHAAGRRLAWAVGRGCGPGRRSARRHRVRRKTPWHAARLRRRRRHAQRDVAICRRARGALSRGRRSGSGAPRDRAGVAGRQT